MSCKYIKPKNSHPFANKEEISDDLLKEAIRLAQGGKFDSDLKGGIIVQRIKRKQQGKNAGYRVIIIFKHQDKSFFVDGYIRRDKNRLTKDDIEGYRELATIIRSLDEAELQIAIRNGEFIKVEQ